ncbi:MAG: flagellar motor protein MotB [Alphaproteobacteria bacterium]
MDETTQESEFRSSSWLLIFADLLALLIAFFVLLYSMSTPKENSFEILSQNFSSKSASTLLTGEKPRADSRQKDALPTVSKQDTLDLSYTQNILMAHFKKSKVLQNAVFWTQADSLVLSLPHKVFFEKKRQKISKKGRKTLTSLAMVLNNMDTEIEVWGYQNPKEAQSTRWAKALSDAVYLSKTLKNLGYDHKIETRGRVFTQIPASIARNKDIHASPRTDIIIRPFLR